MEVCKENCGSERHVWKEDIVQAQNILYGCSWQQQMQDIDQTQGVGVCHRGIGRADDVEQMFLASAEKDILYLTFVPRFNGTRTSNSLTFTDLEHMKVNKTHHVTELDKKIILSHATLDCRTSGKARIDAATVDARNPESAIHKASNICLKGIGRHKGLLPLSWRPQPVSTLKG